MEVNKTTIGIVAGVAGTLFLGYCYYFDQKRRKDPDYKRKVRERRRRQRKSGGARSEFPNLTDHEAVQKYFLQEIQAGETLISMGDIEQGVEHLANAVVFCGQPSQLLQVLQQTLPSNVFALLVHRMRETNHRLTEMSKDKVIEDMNDDLE